MDIDRNDGKYEPGQHEAPFPFDVRLLDEAGKVIESSNGNEGLMPAPRSEYEGMLLEARDPYIPESMLNQGDIMGQEVEDGPNEGSVVVKESVLDSGKPLPSKHEYLPKSGLTPDDEPGDTRVIFGPNEGKVVIDESEWNELESGRASMYVPEDELEEYDLESQQGDLTLPKPTSDRDRLQSHATFWKYLGQQFGQQFDQKVEEVYNKIEQSDDPLETIMSLSPEEMVVNPEGFAAE
jgi:hypothetical protein